MTTTPNVERLATNVYRVPSRTGGPAHVITMNGPNPVCSCDARTHLRICWAAKIVAEYHPQIVAAETPTTDTGDNEDIWDFG